MFSAWRNSKALQLMSVRIQHVIQVDCSVKTLKYSWQGSNKHEDRRLEPLQVSKDYKFHSFVLKVPEGALAQNFILWGFAFIFNCIS